jgi:hypothetical protein
MRRFLTILIVGLLGVAAVRTEAAVLVDKPLDVSTNLAGFQSNSGGLQIAEDFVLAGAAQATLIKFSGWFFTSGKTTGSFEILFFADSGGLPDANHFFLHNTGLITGVFQAIDQANNMGTFPVNVFEWTAVIPAASFPSAGTYWVSIRGPNATVDPWVWEHSTTSGDATVADRFANGDPWQPVGVGSRDTHAVRIEGDFSPAAVPEPTSLVTFAALSCFLVAGSSRRMRRPTCTTASLPSLK